MVKCCAQCARLGTRGFLNAPGNRPVCRNRAACRRRAQFVGRWIGTRTQQLREANGTLWQIRPATWVDHPDAAGFVLVCLYRDHRTTSWHPTIDAAKIHRVDVIRSWEARTLADYGRANG